MVVFGPQLREATMFSGKLSGSRTLAGQLCRAVFIACVIAAICSLAPTFGQLLPPVNLPGLIDALVHAPPATGSFAYNSFVPANTVGASYRDPVFGTTVRRVTTDHTSDDIYARNMWWNADETRYLHRGCCANDHWDVIEVATGRVTHTGITGYGGLAADGGFDPVDPNALYYFSGSSIHKVTLNAGGTWSDAIYFTTPGSQTILDNGGTINWMDASGHYMVVRYGPEPSMHVFDRQNLAAGPYANAVDGVATAGSNGYAGLSPDGQYLVGYEDNVGIGVTGSTGVSWKLDHPNRAIAASPNYFWSLCGDHGSFISASDGRNYMVVTDCTAHAELWRVDITNNAAGLTEAQQRALPNNKLLLAFPTWTDFGHYATVAKGALKDWAFTSTEDSSDTFNSGTADANGNITPWHAYRQEIVAINVITGEIRRVAHHRSRQGTDYYDQPRLWVSWGGQWAGWSSDFNQSGVHVIYAVQFSLTASPDDTPPTVSLSAPATGATVSGTAVTVLASASDNVGVAGVQIKLDGVNLGAEDTVAPYSVAWNTTLATSGTHSLTAVARDAAGNTATAAAVSVSVDNTPPMNATV